MSDKKGFAANAFRGVTGILDSVGINILPEPVQRLQQSMTEQGFTRLTDFMFGMKGGGDKPSGDLFESLAAMEEGKRAQLVSALRSTPADQFPGLFAHLDDPATTNRIEALLANDQSFGQLVEFMTRAPEERRQILAQIDIVKPEQVDRLAQIVAQNGDFLARFKDEDGAAKLNAIADVIDGEHSLLNGVSGSGPANPAMQRQVAGIVAGMTPEMLDAARDLLTTEQYDWRSPIEKGREATETAFLGSGEDRIDTLLAKIGAEGSDGIIGTASDKVVPGIAPLAELIADSAGEGGGDVSAQSREQLRGTLLALQTMPQGEFDKLKSVATELQSLGTPADRQELLAMAMDIASNAGEGQAPASGRQHVAGQLRELAGMPPDERAEAIDKLANPQQLEQAADGIAALQGMEPAERTRLLEALEGLGLAGLEGTAVTQRREELQETFRNLKGLDPAQRENIQGFAATLQGMEEKDQETFGTWFQTLSKDDFGQINDAASDPIGHGLSAVFNKMGSPLGMGLIFGIAGLVLGILADKPLTGLTMGGLIGAFLGTSDSLRSPERTNENSADPSPIGPKPDPGHGAPAPAQQGRDSRCWIRSKAFSTQLLHWLQAAAIPVYSTPSAVADFWVQGLDLALRNWHWTGARR
ncbi:MAG: hypothetical protein EOM26_10100 [Alphaproteobacteria bacterium]|nr:hypothetical protein [Alphaproteobacteria bacterium]